MKSILIAGLSHQYGGAESIMLGLVSQLSQQGFRFEMLCAFQASITYQDRLDALNIKTHRVPSWGTNRKEYAAKVNQLLSEQHFDYVWYNTTNATNIQLLQAVQKTPNTKMIVHCHGSGIEANSSLKRMVLSTLHVLNRPRFNRLIDLKFSCSDKATQWLFTKKSSVHMINNGIQTSDYVWNPTTRQRIRDEFNIGAEYLWMHIGRLSQIKNHSFLLQVFQRYRNANPDTRLVIVGSGELEQELIQKVKELGLENHVIMTGFRKDIPDLLQAADLVLLPSFKEGLPVVLVEAQVSNLPCIVSDTITKDLLMNSNVHYASIHKVDQWVQLAKMERNNARMDRQTMVVEHGFDSKTTAQDIIRLL